MSRPNGSRPNGSRPNGSRPDGHQLTVIIPSWNQAQLLHACLTSLHQQTRLPAILVVDNGSRDETHTVLSRFPGVQCRRLPENQGFAKAVNAALSTVKTPYVALLNNDTEAHPEWVEQGLLGFSRYSDYSFFASRIVHYFDRRYLDSAGDCYPPSGLPGKRGLGQLQHLFDSSCEVLGASAGAAFYRRSMFDDTGMLDEDFYMYLEDVEFSLRARMLGHRCRYLPGAIVYHMEAASDPERESLLPKRGRTAGAGAAGPPRIYYSATRVFWITRNRWNLMIIYQPAAHTLSLVSGWVKSTCFHLLKAGFFGAFVRGLWAGLRSTPRSWRKRREWEQRCKLTTRQRRLLFRLC